MDVHGELDHVEGRDALALVLGMRQAGVGQVEGGINFIGGHGRLRRVDDDEAIAAFDALCRFEGIIPALESSHALAEAIKRAPKLGKDKILLVNLSGRGDKDMENIMRYKNEHKNH